MIHSLCPVLAVCALEVCHFDFPSVDDGCLADLRGAFDKASDEWRSIDTIRDFVLTQ